MTRPFARPALIALALAAGPAVAQQSVVVELFTSQGCSSCPPADAILRELAAMEGVIPLALHVDYWDYIGWQDSFGSPAHTARQERYALMAGERTVYTPQFVIGGEARVVGADAMAVMAAIQAEASEPSQVTLSARAEGGELILDAARLSGAETLVIQLVRYLPHESVDVLHGENAGQRLDYANIVTDWQVLGLWQGEDPLTLRTDLAGDGPAVVILQAEGPGPIRAAVKVGG